MPQEGDMRVTKNGVEVFTGNAFLSHRAYLSQKAVDKAERLLCDPDFDPMEYLLDAYAYLIEKCHDDHPIRKLVGPPPSIADLL
jgi:hypothetical protein